MPAPESNDETMHDIAQSEASCEVERGPTIAAPRLGANGQPFGGRASVPRHPRSQGGLPEVV